MHTFPIIKPSILTGGNQFLEELKGENGTKHPPHSAVKQFIEAYRHWGPQIQGLSRFTKPLYGN